MSARYTLYGVTGSGPAYKVALMLALTGEAFNYEHVALSAGAHKSPEFLARNRFGQVPALHDSSNGRNLAQSASILEYLADKTGKLGGATLEDRYAIREWMFWDFDKLSHPIYRQRAANLGYRSFDPAVLAMYATDGEVALNTLNTWLSTRDWMVGEGVTMADVAIYGVVDYAKDAGYDLATFSALSAWLARFRALPGFATAQVLMPTPAAA